MRRLGPYELVRRLGAGAMAEVWIARRTGPAGGVGRQVTLSLLHGRALAVPEHRSQVFELLGQATQLSNSNIVSVIEFTELEGQWVLVTDHVEGVTLAELAAWVRAAGQRLSYPVVAYVIGELLRALAYAHELPQAGRRPGVVHGALSAQEVLLSSAGEVELTGFGLARMAAELGGGAAAMRYMPPEQLAGSREPSVDLFAVGGVLHELLDGHEFRVQALDEAQLYAAVRDGRTAPLSPQHADYPVQLESLRGGLLAPRLDFRIPSARAALQLLHQWPGYRNAALELEGLVRSCMQARQPAPALPPDSPLRESSATVLIDQAQIFVDAQAEAPEQHPNREQDPPIAAPVGPAPVEVDEGPSLATLLMVGGLVVVALLFVLLGIGFAVGWWGPKAKDQAELVEAEPNTEVEEPSELEPEPEPALPAAELTPEVEAGPAPVELEAPEGPLPGAEPVPEIDSEPPVDSNGSGGSGGSAGSGGSGSSGKTRRRARKTVSVTLTERHYETLQVKIDGRVYTFDNEKSVKLSPGPHTLRLREADDQPWRPAGKIELEVGKRYEITLLDPPLAMVKTL